MLVGFDNDENWDILVSRDQTTTSKNSHDKETRNDSQTVDHGRCWIYSPVYEPYERSLFSHQLVSILTDFKTYPDEFFSPVSCQIYQQNFAKVVKLNSTSNSTILVRGIPPNIKEILF